MLVVTGHQRERRDAVDDLGVDGDDIAVGEGEHGVQVHGRPQLGHSRNDHLLGRGLLEQLGRDLSDGLAGGALAHADQHHAVSGNQHVATLEGG